MRLLVELTSFQKGTSYGFEEYVSNLLRYCAYHIDDLRVDEVIISCRESQIPYFKNLTKGVFTIIGVNSKRKIDRVLASYNAMKQAKIQSDDIILFPCNGMPILPFPGNKILVVHDLLFKHGDFCAKSLKFWLFRLNLYVHMPVSLKKANKIIAISEYAKSEILKYYNIEENKISVIYNFFGFDKFGSEKNAQSDSLLNSDYFISVCSRVKHKNHVVFLKAFRRIAEEDTSINYVIVGGISDDAKVYYDELPDNVKKRIHFFEHISNEQLSRLYQHAKAFVSSSLYEGLGMPVVEAMYFNCPVILSDLSVHREVSMNLGAYFNPTDYMALYELMKVEDGHRRNYSERIEEMYIERNTSAKYIEEINRMISQEILRGGGKSLIVCLELPLIIIRFENDGYVNNNKQPRYFRAERRAA